MGKIDHPGMTHEYMQLAGYCLLTCLKPGQVLPSRMVVMAEPNPDSLLAALEEAVQRVDTVDPMLQHQQVTTCCAILLVLQCQLSDYFSYCQSAFLFCSTPVVPPPPVFPRTLPCPTLNPTPTSPLPSVDSSLSSIFTILIYRELCVLKAQTRVRMDAGAQLL